MRKYTVEKPNHHQIACVEEIPCDPHGICIAVHGFTSSKESPTVRMLLEKLPAAGIGVVGIDLPSHGEETSYEEELRLSACLDSLALVEKDVVERYPDADIYYFGSSFGAYVTALYISTRPHKGRKAFFRSAAVNMPSLFLKDSLTEEDEQLMKELKENGYFMQGFSLGRPVKITQGFMDDLAGNDLFDKFDPERFGPHRIAMAHGSEDPVIDPAKAESFAVRFGIEKTVFEGEGHSLCNDPSTPGKVADLAIALYLDAGSSNN